MGCTIRWPRARLKQRSGAPTVDATYVASVFEFSDHDCENACTPPVQPTIMVPANLLEVVDTIVTRHQLPLWQYHLWMGCSQIPNDIHTRIETETNDILIYVVAGRTGSPK